MTPGASGQQNATTPEWGAGMCAPRSRSDRPFALQFRAPHPSMTLHLPTLNFISIAMLAMSAGIMTLFGSSGRVYRGFWWWAAAQWLLALGLLLHSLRDHP